LTVATTAPRSESLRAASGPAGTSGALEAVRRAGAAVVVSAVVGVGVEAAVVAGAELVVVDGVGVGVPVDVGVGVPVDVGVGVPVGEWPLVHVTELPSADRTQVICDPVLPVEVGAGVGVADPLPALGGFGVVVVVVRGVRGVPGTLTGTVVVVTVRPPLVTALPTREGEVTLVVREPAARLLLTALAIAMAPDCASFAPAYPAFWVVRAWSILRNQSATAATCCATCSARCWSGVSGGATGPGTTVGAAVAGAATAVATAAGTPAIPRTRAVPAATKRVAPIAAPSRGLGVAVKRWIKPMRLPVDWRSRCRFRWRSKTRRFGR
jgi:hypothetical protein